MSVDYLALAAGLAREQAAALGFRTVDRLALICDGCGAATPEDELDRCPVTGCLFCGRCQDDGPRWDWDPADWTPGEDLDE